jgi:hypothetical protein
MATTGGNLLSVLKDEEESAKISEAVNQAVEAELPSIASGEQVEF